MILADLSVAVIRVADGEIVRQVAQAFPPNILTTPVPLSSDGQLLAITQPDTRVLRVSDGSTVFQGGDGLYFARFNADASQLVGRTVNSHVETIHLPDGASRQYAMDRFVNYATFSDGGTVVTLDDTGLVRDENTGDQVSVAYLGFWQAFLSSSGRYVGGISLDPLPTGPPTTRTMIYSVADHKVAWSHVDPLPGFYPGGILFSPDDQAVLEIGTEQSAVLDVATGTVRGTPGPPVHSGSQWALGRGADPLLTLDKVGIALWRSGDFAHPARLAVGSLEGTGQVVKSVTVSPDGRSVAFASDDALTVWDSSTRRQRWVARGGATSVAYSPDGTRLLATSAWLEERSAADGTLIAPVPPGHCVPALSASYAADGHTIGAALQWGFVLLANAADPTFEPALAPGLPMAALAFAPDGKTLVTSEPALYRLADRTRVWPAAPPVAGPDSVCFPRPDGHLPGAVAFSPDGNLVAARASVLDVLQPKTTVLHAATGEPVLDAGPATRPRPVFSPDSAWLLNGATVYKVDGSKPSVALKIDIPAEIDASVFMPDGTIWTSASGIVFLFCPSAPGTGP